MTTTAKDTGLLRATTKTGLAIAGLPCAPCAARIGRNLTRPDGVTATVNYATEKANVAATGGVTVEDLIATVEKTGYTAQLPAPPPGAAKSAPGEPIDELRPLRTRLITSAVLTVPVVALAMVP